MDALITLSSQVLDAAPNFRTKFTIEWTLASKAFTSFRAGPGIIKAIRAESAVSCLTLAALCVKSRVTIARLSVVSVRIVFIFTASKNGLSVNVTVLTVQCVAENGNTKQTRLD